MMNTDSDSDSDSDTITVTKAQIASALRQWDKEFKDLPHEFETGKDEDRNVSADYLFSLLAAKSATST